MKGILLGLAMGVVFAAIIVMAFSTPAASVAPVALTTDTQVLGAWREPSGAVVGTYTTTLGELNDNSGTVRELTIDVADMKAVVGYLTTDPTMRGHLLRHGMTKARLDALARRFGTVAP